MSRAEMQTRTCIQPFETRADDNGKHISGYFAVFGSDYEMWDGVTESIDPHAFDGELNKDIRCLIDHESRLVLGRTTAGSLTLKTDEHGLWGDVLINENDTDAMNLYSRVQRGDVNQCSFGFQITDEEFEDRGNGKAHWTIKGVNLFEVSCVTFPAYRDTEISARKEQLADIERRKLETLKESVRKKLKGE